MQGITLDKLLIKLSSFYTSGLKPYLKSNKVAYNSPTKASDYEIGKGLCDQLLFPIQFIKKPAKWKKGKVTNTSKCTSYLCASTVHCIIGPLRSYADYTFYMYNIDEFVSCEIRDLLVASEHTCRCAVYSQQQIHKILKVTALWLEQEVKFAIFFPKE